MFFVYLSSLTSDEQRTKFEQLYQKYFSFMYRTALKVTRNPSLAEDAVHETFLQILKEIDAIRLENDASLKYYLYTITRERSIDFLRKWERRKNSSAEYSESIPDCSGAANPDTFVLTRAALDSALDTLHRMPDVYRYSLILSVRGYSIREIAHITHCSESAAKSHIYRARQKLLAAFPQET